MFTRLMTVIVTCCFICSAETKIIETSHIADVVPLIDQDTWFLVDLDHTLFEAKQACGHAHWFYDELQRLMTEGMSRDEAICAMYPKWIKTQRVCPVKPLEEDFVTAIKAMQAKKIVVMGFTHRQVPVADSTVAQVESLGIDFSLTAPSSDTFSIPAKAPTLYTHGILFVADYNKKGEVLLPFLTMIQKTPKKVVFIDDKLKNVEEVESTLIPQGIEYIGVFYNAIDKAPPVYSRELAEFQYQYLDKIMSNEAAKLLMQHGIN